MNPSAVRIRISDDGDRERILVAHRNAFGGDEGPVIARLVEELLADPTGKPIFSLVAVSLGGGSSMRVPTGMSDFERPEKEQQHNRKKGGLGCRTKTRERVTVH